MTGERDRTLKRRATRDARKLMRRGMAAGLVAIGACSDSHAPAHDASTVIADASTGSSQSDQNNDPFGNMPEPLPMSGAASDSGSFPFSDLIADVVIRSEPARDVLYSWTTAKQIAELRADPTLLTRSESSDGKRPQASMVIAALAAAGDPIAQALTSPKFEKGRYAWSNAWATARGWPGETYGDHLLRIVLKPEAWTAIVTRDSIRVIAINNTEVESSVALASPERIGAVFFMNQGDLDSGGCFGTFITYDCAIGAYREYFINNESMVLEWSFGTRAILHELERSIDVATAFREHFASNRVQGECEFSRSTYCAWESTVQPLANGPPLDRYQLGLALTSDFYEPTIDNMDALIAALKARLFTPDPFEHKP